MDYIKQVVLLAKTVGITEEELDAIVSHFLIDSSSQLTQKSAEVIYQNPDQYFNWVLYGLRSREPSCSWDHTIQFLDKLSAGIIVEVVRCSECVYGRKQSSDKMFRACSLSDRWERPNHFCAKGKIEDK